MSDTLTTNEVAGMLDTDAKTLRKFFRSDKCEVEPVGQGKRYVLTTKDVKKIEKAFHAWNEGKSTRASKADKPTSDEFNTGPATATSKPKRGKAKAEPVEELDDEDLELDEEEPDDDDLAELEGELEDLDIE